MPRPTLAPWLLALALVACTPPADPPADPAASSAPPKAAVEAKTIVPDSPPPERPSSWTDPPRTHVLLLRHADDAPELDVLPLALTTAGPPTLLPAFRGPALPRADWADHYAAVVTHGGQATWARAAGREGAWIVVHEDTHPGASPREVPIGATIPAAMHMLGAVVIVGAGNTVGRVDLSAASPGWEVLHERPDMRWKAYDLFARAGDWLVAIDDEVTPMYADAFTVDAQGHAIHRAGWSLPGVINGHYGAAVLGRTGPAKGTLFVVASYGIMDGHGQDLAALAIEDDALAIEPDVILNSHAMDEPPVLEEHVSRETGKPEKLAFGSDYTPWTGMARVEASGAPPRLLLAAGSRGLLVVPEVFTSTTKAESIDVGGECADVLGLEGGRVLVLVGAPAPAVLELRATATGLEPATRLGLPDAYHRFVR